MQPIFIDLGSHTVRWLENNVLFQEPCRIACHADSWRVLGYGANAERLALNPELALTLVSPLRHKDYPDSALIPFLRYFRKKMNGSNFCIAMPDDLPENAWLPICETFAEAGLVPAQFTGLMAALHRHCPPDTLIVHAGARRTQLGWFEDGRLKFSRSLLWGGQSLDEQLRAAVRQRFRLEIGPKTAEQLKLSIGGSSERTVKGLDLISRTPRNAAIPMELCREAAAADFDPVAVAVRKMLELAPGIRNLKLSGGTANFTMFADYLRRQFDLFVLRDPHPELAVLRGMEKMR